MLTYNPSEPLEISDVLLYKLTEDFWLRVTIKDIIGPWLVCRTHIVELGNPTVIIETRKVYNNERFKGDWQIDLSTTENENAISNSSSDRQLTGSPLFGLSP